MKIEIRKSDNLYDEFITYMSYRYAIGLTMHYSDRPDKQLKQYELFEKIEFDTPEFHALASEISQYLKRRKIATIADLRQREIEQQLIWFSYHYAMGRHSYAASLCDDIAQYAPQIMSEKRLIFTAFDIRREIAQKLTWSPCAFKLPIDYERNHGPLDELVKFLISNNINTKEELAKYSWIELVQDYDGNTSYRTELAKEETKYSFFTMDIEDLMGWEDLSFLLDPQFHKKCLVRYNGKEETIKYFNSWNILYNQDSTFSFERVKRPIYSPTSSTYRNCSLIEEYIVEDNIQ